MILALRKPAKQALARDGGLGGQASFKFISFVCSVCISSGIAYNRKRSRSYV